MSEWEIFMKTGRISDYLKYIEAERADGEEEQGEDSCI